MSNFGRVIVKRRLNASKERVFDAWTKPELMAKWYFPMSEGWSVDAKADARVGGSYDVAMRSPDGAVHGASGEYRELTRATKIVFTWDSRDHEVKGSIVTVTLEDAGPNQTTLTITHDLPADDKVCASHLGGWTACSNNLDRFLSQ